MNPSLSLPTLTVAQLVSDVWLGDRLQKLAFRLKLDGNLPGSLAELSTWNAQRWRSHLPSPAFCDACLPCDRVDGLRLLESLGFGLVDTTIMLQCCPTANTGLAETSRSSVLTVRPAQPADREALVALAGRAFRYSRFHLDPEVDGAIADQIKADWVANCCDGNRGDRLWVAIWNGEIAGFLAAIVAPAAAPRIAIIDLVAVDPRLQGQGIGRSLVIEFMQHYRDRCTLLQVGTQAANISALRLYTSFGFAVTQSQYLLHYHAPPSVS